MLQIDPRALLRTLNRYCTRAMERAAGAAVSRAHHEVTVDHVLAELSEDPQADVQIILRHFEVDPGRLQKAVARQLEGLKGGNSGRPVLSPLLLRWLQESWLLASTEFQQGKLRSGLLLATLHLSPHSFAGEQYAAVLEGISAERLRLELRAIVGTSIEEQAIGAAAIEGEAAPTPRGPHGRGPDTALGRFTIDFTAEARAGKVDPVVGREVEIRQCIDILARRRKNNPIIVGEAGVGKTALVEGLAQRVVDRDVPATLGKVEILGLDVGLLQAGASVKGEFESRLKAVIEEVQGSPTPIILFIDEAHTLIGAGGPQGGADAANLLKPALARGELRTIAATTWSEYKKYFEKDPALTRRFQRVQVDEPDEPRAVAMLRGIAPHYERSHSIRILDSAVVAAAELSHRYISGRYLPDKAVDLLDTAAARAAIAQQSKPPSLDDMERRIYRLGREQASLIRDREDGHEISDERLQAIEEELASMAQTSKELEARWQAEQAAAQRVVALRRELARRRKGEDDSAEVPPDEQPAPAAEGGLAGAADSEASGGPGEGGGATAIETETAQAPYSASALRELDSAGLANELAAAQAALAAAATPTPLIPVDVTAEVVAQVVADWTGIPVGKMVDDEAQKLLEFETRIGERIKGQDYALKLIGESIRAAKMGLGNPRAPLGVFLLVGPSGVGKTETALAIADLLFGGERFLVTVNMSEFQEKHTVSRLIGSPPGYIGFGEGGVLTEAIRQHPYSAVVLDEVEKADPEVMNLFYQVFDKGVLSDGEGRVIDFSNTVILMTSNLGSDTMMRFCTQPAESPPTREQIVEAIRPQLVGHFKPALLARMKIVPYFPLSEASLSRIVRLKLDQLCQRMSESQGVELSTSEAVVGQIVARCTEVESGARNIDHILSRTLLPLLSRALLAEMSAGPAPERMALDVDEEGAYELKLDASQK